MKILVVDDDELTLATLEHALRRHGHEVETATNGRDALEKLKLGACRLVISDWEMPQMSGVELCRAIRGGDFPGYIYTILLTSRDAAADAVQGLAAGADDFVTKPFNPAELAQRVRTGERILALETRDLVIFAMAKLAESRDPDTGTHLERVQNYSRIIAEHLSRNPKFSKQMDPTFVRLIYLTSPLHDIGKVAIPDSVLLKPGRLSDREFEIMKTHTTMGAATLDAALREHPEASFLRMARDIAISHHEHYSGRGYPNGLVGEAIPLAGRIVAAADVYDAMTSRRVYKAEFTHEIAKSIILKESGTHFDPAVVEAFVQAEEEIIRVQNRFESRPSISAAA